jgi:hypothetical protein
MHSGVCQPTTHPHASADMGYGAEQHVLLLLLLLLQEKGQTVETEVCFPRRPGNGSDNGSPYG